MRLFNVFTTLFTFLEAARCAASAVRYWRKSRPDPNARKPVEFASSVCQTDLTSKAIQDAASETEDLKRKLGGEAQESQNLRIRLGREKSAHEENKDELRGTEAQLCTTRCQLAELSKKNTTQAKNLKEAFEEIENRGAFIQALQARLCQADEKCKELNHQLEASRGQQHREKEVSRELEASRKQLQHDKEQHQREREQHAALRSRAEELEAELFSLRARLGSSSMRSDGRPEAAEPVEAASDATPKMKPVQATPARSVLCRASQWEAVSSQAKAAAPKAATRPIMMPRLCLDGTKEPPPTPPRDPHQQMREKMRAKLDKTEARATASPMHQAGTVSSPTNDSSVGTASFGTSHRRAESPVGNDTFALVPPLPPTSAATEPESGDAAGEGAAAPEQEPDAEAGEAAAAPEQEAGEGAAAPEQEVPEGGDAEAGEDAAAPEQEEPAGGDTDAGEDAAAPEPEEVTDGDAEAEVKQEETEGCDNEGGECEAGEHEADDDGANKSVAQTQQAAGSSMRVGTPTSCMHHKLNSDGESDDDDDADEQSSNGCESPRAGDAGAWGVREGAPALRRGPSSRASEESHASPMPAPRGTPVAPRGARTFDLSPGRTEETSEPADAVESW